ncbi:MAG: glycosyltransferase family 4 protein [Hungatella sp.]|nr:glycosyltransferase family 4 protein [Hungatella sp.]
MRKLLIYNWTHIDDKQGGGVNLYVRNIIQELISQGEYDIYYLNAGRTYTKKGSSQIIEVDTPFGQKLQAFEIINSPFIAPVRQNGKNINYYLTDKSVASLFDDFIIDHGISVIHFNNIEGLPLEVLRIKQRLPGIKVIYSAHNYFTLCSRTNLWQDGELKEGHNCNKKDYTECDNCYRQSIYSATILSRVYPPLKHLDKLSRYTHVHSDPILFRRFHKETVSVINSQVDVVLAVSDRMRELLINGGISSGLIRTSYIGTRVADKQLSYCRTDSTDIFRVAYMGYMQKEKGFYFFLNALEHMDINIAKNIEIHIIARYKTNSNKNEISRINELKKKFYNVILINGYTRDNQEKLLENINLGVIPVLWEDSLPQVAIEQMAYGVPILTSDLGGAWELHRNEHFVYSAGDYDDFEHKLKDIYYNRELLNDFWTHAMRLVDMQEHIRELRGYYEQ